jgi:hypothetical protein
MGSKAIHLTSEDVNYMVYRYLQESGGRPMPAAPASLPRGRQPQPSAERSITSLPAPLAGFQHTAFSFAHESNVHKTDIDPNAVPPGALVTFIQRGMQYLEMEANIDIQVRRGAAGASLAPRARRATLLPCCLAPPAARQPRRRRQPTPAPTIRAIWSRRTATSPASTRCSRRRT